MKLKSVILLVLALFTAVSLFACDNEAPIEESVAESSVESSFEERDGAKTKIELSDGQIYENALKLIEEREYKQAYIDIKSLGGYKDCRELLDKFTVRYGKEEYISYNGRDEILAKWIYVRDENGNETVHEVYGKGGAFEEKTAFEYDEYNNLKKYTVYDEDGKAGCTREQVIEYDENGNMTLFISCDGYKTEYAYDGNGNKNLMVEYDPDGALLFKYEFVFDESGNEILCTTYDKNGDIDSVAEKEYDKNGRIVRIVWRDGEGSISVEEERTYDERGYLIYHEKRNGEGKVIYKQESEYDANGNQTLNIQYKEGGEEIEFMYRCVYDEYNSLISTSNYDVNQELLSTVESEFKYEFDEKGNMTLKIECVKGTGEELSRESFEYDENGFLKRRTQDNGDTMLTTEYVYSDPMVFYLPDFN